MRPAENPKAQLVEAGWQGESLRLTAFPATVMDIANAAGWFKQVVGEESESRNLKRGAALDEMGHTEEVPACRVGLHVDPSRADWRVVPDPHEDEGFERFSSLIETLHGFETLVARWLRIAPPLRRLAFGTILLRPITARVEGYRILDDYLPLVDLASGGEYTDILFQINRPTSSQMVPNLRLNRLSKWSVAKLDVVLIQVSPHVSHLGNRDSRFAVRLELDINTDETRVDRLPEDQLIPLLRELVDAGLKIAVEGDVS